MWVELATWIAQDDRLELTVGDHWTTKLSVSLDRAEEVEASAPLGIHLLAEPPSLDGPRYEVTVRVKRDPDFGVILDAGSLLLDSSSFTTWPDAVVLRLESPLLAGPGLDLRSDHPAWREWRVRQIHLRQWDLVPDSEPNSYRPDPNSVRIRPIERMQIWQDEKDPVTAERIHSDYILRLA